MKKNQTRYVKMRDYGANFMFGAISVAATLTLFSIVVDMEGSCHNDGILMAAALGVSLLILLVAASLFAAIDIENYTETKVLEKKLSK